MRWPGRGRKRELPGAACLLGLPERWGRLPVLSLPTLSICSTAGERLARPGGRGGAARGCDPWAGAAPPVPAAAWPEGEGGRAAAASLPSPPTAVPRFVSAPRLGPRSQ